ncbi:hypothetical protein C1752_10970 [Acaryochloris thomasi RCC1774]|uniref:Uncharacterized protein n=1 Tax=Acaryochloris thomasi RCC1774 TaxID=1764569 RepID=A0A2W1JMN6_9CYAN|nr:hypothetical protein [Acaryochloris thomasi]PZD70541.1 hypothetical protein C1752_10970 [Acaryochloris thomasi RCC1774]
MAQPNIPQNVYSHKSEQHPNILLGSLQLLFWIFLQPSAWHHHITRMNLALKPDFSWAEVSFKQWGRFPLYRLLLQSYLIVPLLTGGLLTLFFLSVGMISDGLAFQGLIAGMVGGLTLATTIGMGLGVALGVASSVAGIVAGGVAGILTNGLWGGLAVGVATGVVIGVSGQMECHKKSNALTRQISGTVVGVLLGSFAGSIALCLAAFIILIGLIRAGYGFSYSSFIGLSVLILYTTYGAVIFIRTGKWRPSLVFGTLLSVLLGMVFVAILGAMTGLIALLTSLDSMFGLANEFTGGGLMGAVIGVSTGLLLSIYYLLPYAIAERIAGPKAGAIAGALASCSSALMFAEFESKQPIVTIWAYGLLGLALGLTLPWWRSLLSYPITVPFNSVLYFLDRKRASHRPSLLPFHSAFWDEHQSIRLRGLDKHIVLVAKRNPAEGQAAIEFLGTSRQRWAARAAQIEIDALR